MTLAGSRPDTGEVTAVPMVTLTIDGFEVSVPKGTMVIRAAETLGIQIPRFCDHPLLNPVGACRQCLVEIEMGGRPMPKPQASCTIEVAEGMVVRTQLTSQVAEKAQRGIMELLLINHPLDCPICDKGGECPLQNQAMSSGAAESRFQDVKRTYQKPVAISSQVLLDRERCVLCARCTRFSQQIAGDPFIELFERSALQQVAVYSDDETVEPFQSYFSGNTIQICPVGALTSATYRFRARPFDLKSTPTACEHCASGCSLRADWRRGKVTRRLSGEDPEVNEEWNCDKGRFAFTYATQNDRLLAPMVRDESGELVEVSWTEALERAGEGLREARDAGGVGVLPGGRLTYEDAYAYAKFARLVLGTNDVDSRAREHSDEELGFLGAHVAGTVPGAGGVTYRDLERAPAVLLAGFEPEEESPIVFLRLRKAVAKHGLRVFAVAPFETPALRKTEATLIPTPPRAEANVLGAIADGTAGGPGVAAGEAMRTPGAVILVGERLAEVPGALTAAADFAAATGARLAWVPRRAGERGAIDAGALPTLLPGARAVDDGVARAQVAEVWGVDPSILPSAPGRDITGILTAARDGALAALVVGGVDPGDLPDPALAEAALDQVGFVVSLELRESAVTAKADVVLPVAAAAEKAGTFVDWEGRRRPFDLTLSGTGLLHDGRILHGLAEEMDADLGLPTVQSARDELERIGVAGRRPVADRVAPRAVPRPEQGQAVLASWRQLLDAGSMQAGEPHLAETRRPAVVRMSAATAAELGANEGDTVTVASDRGRIALPLAITEMPNRVVWVPMNSPGAPVRRELGVGPGAVVRIAADGGAR